MPLGASLGDRVDSEVRAQARSQADVVAASAPELLEHSQRITLRRLVDSSAEAARGRVVVVDGAGQVLADSVGAGEVGTDYANRPEIAAALQGAGYQQTRYSDTLGAELLATAVPILNGGRPAGAVRITQSVAAVNRATRRNALGLIALGAVVLALGVLAAALIARETTAPIGRLEQAARRVEEGDLNATAPVEGSSEQRSLARSFNRMTGRLAQLLSGQQRFVADASHQLRTPLTGIRLQLEEMREELAPEDPRAAELDGSLEEVDRLAHMVDELLVLSRAGERDGPAGEIDIAAAAERARERWRKTAAKSRIVLTHERRGTAGSCRCSPADFERALDSLIENALRYSPAGGQVVISSGPDSVDVLDDGPGLAPGEEETVFDRFHRGTASRGTKGTGLGLAIARELAEEWGGSVRIGNRPGGGARASLQMPREAAGVGSERG